MGATSDADRHNRSAVAHRSAGGERAEICGHHSVVRALSAVLEAPSSEHQAEARHKITNRFAHLSHALFDGFWTGCFFRQKPDRSPSKPKKHVAFVSGFFRLPNEAPSSSVSRSRRGWTCTSVASPPFRTAVSVLQKTVCVGPLCSFIVLFWFWGGASFWRDPCFAFLGYTQREEWMTDSVLGGFQNNRLNPWGGEVISLGPGPGWMTWGRGR